MALHEIVQVLDANSREIHDLCMSEDFLARFDSYHRTSLLRFLESPKVLNLRTIAESEQIHACLYSQCKQPVPCKNRCERPCQANASGHAKDVSAGDTYFAGHAFISAEKASLGSA